MAKISDTGSYPQAVVTGADYLIGTDSEDSNKTKTFTVDSLSTYILGGGLAYQIPMYLPGGQLGSSIISQDGATLPATITIAGALVVDSDVTLGTDATDALIIEATARLNGPIKDSAGTVGSLGKALISDASGLVSWQALVGSGTVTSVGLSSSSTGFDVTGSPITSAGTFILGATGGTAGQVLTRDAGSSWQNSILTPSLNGTSVVQVSQESDFPAAVAGEIDLVANTTYLIRGDVSITNKISITGANISLMGLDRDKDGLSYTGPSGVGDFITITDVNCEMSELKFSSTNNTGGDVLIRAENYNYGAAYNGGRDKILAITNCQFRNCFDVWHIEGFDLCDIQNSLVWYVEATVMGCHFKNVSKLQMSSCEYVRWFDETSLPTPSGFATVPMIELLADGAGPGFGAVNFNGGIIHPQQGQDGIKIDPSSTTGLGTIASNTFVSTGLTTGLVTNFSYDTQNTYIIQANQGVSNGNATGVMQVANNTIESNTSGAFGPPYNVVVQDSTFVGGAGPTGGIQFPVASRVVTSSATGSFTYNSKVDASFNVSLAVNITVPANGTHVVSVSLRKNGVTLFTLSQTHRNSGGVFEGKETVLPVIGTTTFGDVFDVLVGIDSAQNIIVNDLYLTGYQI
jgi:hypothetical protein